MKFLTALLAFCLSSLSFADLPPLDVAGMRTSLSPSVEFIEDKKGSMTLDSVIKLPAFQWQMNIEDQVNLGFSTSAFWLKIGLVNSSDRPMLRLIETTYSLLDYLDFYVIRSGFQTEHIAMGDKLPFYQRPILSRNFLVPIKLSPGEVMQIYVRVKTTSATQVPMTLWAPSHYYPISQSRTMMHGIYFGIALVMVLYSLFVYRAVREPVYLHYVAFIICLPMLIATINGLSFQYFWPWATQWNDRAVVFFVGGTVAFGITFAMKFLTVSSQTDYWTYRYLAGLASIAFGVMLVSIFVDYSVLVIPTIVLSLIFCSTLLVLAFSRAWKGDRPARYFILAWMSMLTGGIVLALNKFNILPQNAITEHATQIGSAIEIILLSIALADRLNQEKQNTFNAQQKALIHERKARQSQEQSLTIQREANALLERRVEERTSELSRLNKKLQELSTTDSLTGLKNRRHFDELLEQYCTTAFRYRQSISLLLVDIDHFKSFNDNYGHPLGDQCLGMVAECLRKIVSRSQDAVARIGGEEFGILLADTTESGAFAVAERIRASIEEASLYIGEEMLSVTVSIGICCELPDENNNKDVIFKRADQALYDAKGAGRNAIMGFTDDTEV